MTTTSNEVDDVMAPLTPGGDPGLAGLSDDELLTNTFRTKKELGKLLRELHPLPQLPDRIEPLGPQLRRTLRNPTWAQYVSARAPQIRELPAGERPCDWATDPAPEETALGDLSNEALPVGPVPRDLPPVTGPQHYQVQFSTTEEHAQLVDRAKALLARSRPGMTLGELHLEAMRLLVASLENRRFGAGVQQQPRQRGESDARIRSRYIPAVVRREVFERDAARCSYVDARGERCCETHYLQLHHLQPFAKAGPHVASNLTSRCAAHNALAADADFGAKVMAERRSATKHESLSRQRPEPTAGIR